MADYTKTLSLLVLLLMCVIAGLLVYFLSFHKPSKEQCANLYTTNICTQTYCTDTFPCPDAPSPTWKPTFDTATDRLIGKKMKLPTDDIGKTISSEIATFSNTFDSNICSTLKTLNTTPATLYGYTVPTVAEGAPAGTTADPATFNCMALIKKINQDIASASTNFEKMKLIHLRQTIVDKCNTTKPVGDAVPTGITISADAKINASEFETGGAVSSVFCT